MNAGILLLFLLCYGANGDDVDGSSVPALFQQLATTDIDGLVAARTLGSGVGSFLKTVIPVGGLLTDAYRSDSSTQKTLSLLNKQMKLGFTAMDKQIENSRRLSKLYSVQRGWKKFVDDNIEKFKSRFDYMTDGLENKTEEQISEFANYYCRHKSLGPHNILQYILSEVRCTLPPEHPKNREADQKIIKWLRFMNQLFIHQLNATETQADVCSQDVFLALATVPVSVWDAVLENVKSQTYRGRVHPVCDELVLLIWSYPETSDDECPMELILRGTRYRHEPLHKFALLVSSTASTLLGYGAYCSGIAYNRTSSELEWYTTTLRRKVEEITDILSTWIPKNLERVWPEYEVEYVQGILDSYSTGVISRSVGGYRELTEKIQRNMLGYGVKDYARQILIVLSANRYHLGYLKTNASAFATVSSKGITVVVSRFNVSTYEKLYTAKNWFKNNEKDIRSSLMAHSQVPNVVMVDEFLWKEHGIHLANPDYYATVVIMRDHGMFYCSVDNYAYSDFRHGEFSGTFDWTYYIKTTSGCVQFRMIFFI